MNVDSYLGKYKWYRKRVKGLWFKHKGNRDINELGFSSNMTWWARYGKINRYSNVIKIEHYIEL